MGLLVAQARTIPLGRYSSDQSGRTRLHSLERVRQECLSCSYCSTMGQDLPVEVPGCTMMSFPGVLLGIAGSNICLSGYREHSLARGMASLPDPCDDVCASGRMEWNGDGERGGPDEAAHGIGCPGPELLGRAIPRH